MGITTILSWIVFGLIIGVIARFVMPGRQPMGILFTILLGIAGSFLGGFIASLFVEGPAYLRPSGWIMSTLGAVLLLFIYGRMTSPRLR